MSRLGFDKVMKNMEQAKRRLPIALANEARLYFTNTFKVGGFDGKKWKEVNRRIPGTNEYKYPKKKGLSRRKKPILVQYGLLRRAVSMSVRSKTFKSIRLQVDLPYADNHNEGITVPKRQFMGYSKQLDRQHKRTIEKEIKKIWQV